MKKQVVIVGQLQICNCKLLGFFWFGLLLNLSQSQIFCVFAGQHDGQKLCEQILVKLVRCFGH